MGTVNLALRGKVLTRTEAGSTRFWRDGVVLISGQKIVAVKRYHDARRAFGGPIRDLNGALIMPGFVDAHLHYPQARIIGQATGTLLDWLQTSVFPEEAKFRRRAYAEPVARELTDRMLSMGTTSAMLFSSSSPLATDVLFEALELSGMRAVAGLVLMDARSPKELTVKRDKALAACRKLAGRWHGRDGGRLKFAISPRFALSCSKAMLRAAGRLAAELSLPIQTHVGETPREGMETLAVHKYAKNYVDVYAQAGLLNETTVLAHAIHLSAAEWNQVAAAGSSIAHCPDSNFFLGSGRMKAQALRKKSAIKVALGSDVAAGRSFSMRRAMGYAYDNAMCVKSPLEPAELLEMATLEGSRVLGWGSVSGSLEVGKEADLAVFPLRSDPKTANDALAELIFDTDEPFASETYVRGRCVQRRW